MQPRARLDVIFLFGTDFASYPPFASAEVVWMYLCTTDSAFVAVMAGIYSGICRLVEYDA